MSVTKSERNSTIANAFNEEQTGFEPQEDGSFFRPSDWQLNYLFRLGVGGWIIHALIVVLTAFAQGVSSGLVQSWLAIMLVLTATMFIICIWGGRAVNQPLFGWLHSITTCFVALFWAVGAISFAQSSQGALLVYTLALGGTALGAVSSQHAVLRSCFASIWLSIPGLAAAHFLSEMLPAGSLNATMIMLFGVVLTILAVRMHQFVKTNHQLSQSLAQQMLQSERERLRAEEANLAKSRFIAYASHDLRQPVHAIGMLTELLRGQRLTNKSKETVGHIDRSVQLLSRQFQALMDLSALELGQLEPRLENFALRPVLNDIAHQNRPLARESGSEIFVMGQDATVVADLALTENIVQNVVSNAIKYAPGARISIGTRSRGETISIIVMDRGPGMTEEFRSVAFNEFKRGEPDLQGFGLGLPLVARYSELLNLEAKLYSAPGSGTIVEIAGYKKTPPVEEETKANGGTNWLSDLEVLLVDDDDDGRQATTRLLKSWGCKVQAYAGPPGHLPTFDILLTDYELGAGVSADDLIEACRHSKPGCPVLIVSGSSGSAVVNAEEAGQTLYLQKPVRPAQLRAGLTSLTMHDGMS
jgi:signal transduction histidine kinase